MAAGGGCWGAALAAASSGWWAGGSPSCLATQCMKPIIHEPLGQLPTRVALGTGRVGLQPGDSVLCGLLPHLCRRRLPGVGVGQGAGPLEAVFFHQVGR